MDSATRAPVALAEIIEHLESVLNTLGYVPCQFWACDGPDEPFVDMCTCVRCAQIQETRAMLERLRRDAAPVEVTPGLPFEGDVIAGSPVCPKCGRSNVYYGEVNIANGETRQGAHCLDCGEFYWTEVYQMTRIEVIHE